MAVSGPVRDAGQEVHAPRFPGEKPSVGSLGAKPRDSWWTVLLIDPLALPIVRFLSAKRWFTPDQITIAALVTGVGGGLLFAMGTRWALIVGAILFQLGFLLDCIDGKLARAMRISSPKGVALDALADAGARSAATFGLIVWLWRSNPDAVWYGIAYALLAYLWIEIRGAERGEPGEGRTGSWSAFMARHRMTATPGIPDVQGVVFTLGPLTGLVIPGLVVGSLMMVAGVAIASLRHLRQAQRKARGSA